MQDLIDVVTHATKVTTAIGIQYVLIVDNERQYRRRVQYKQFSNHPIEYICWGSKNYQVNTVRTM